VWLLVGGTHLAPWVAPLRRYHALTPCRGTRYSAQLTGWAAAHSTYLSSLLGPACVLLPRIHMPYDVAGFTSRGPAWSCGVPHGCSNPKHSMVSSAALVIRVVGIGWAC
jgi:hypothetical protein